MAPTALAPDGLELTRAGFVALIGAPNAGKSTLLNRLVGTPLSIVTHKAQTTRMRITGVVIRGRVQIAFVDTPGVFSPRRRLDRAMVDAAWRAARAADGVVMLVDAAAGMKPEEEQILEGLCAVSCPVTLALNKIDRVEPSRLLALARRLNATERFAATFMISALTGDGVDDLLAALAALAPPGPWLFPEDQLTDIPWRLLAAEITREKLFLNTHQELPYALTVETEAWDELSDGSVRIRQIIRVRRASQRAVILGHHGQRIRAIGMAARRDLEAALQRPAHLFLFVKVQPDWEEDRQRYEPWNLMFEA